MTQHVVIPSFHPLLPFEVLHVGLSIRSYVLALIRYISCGDGPSTCRRYNRCWWIVVFPTPSIRTTPRSSNRTDGLNSRKRT